MVGARVIDADARVVRPVRAPAAGLVDLVPGEAEDLVLAPAGVVGEVKDVLPRGGQVGADGEVFGAGQMSEVVLGCEILNRMTTLGRPVSYCLGR